MSFKTITSVHNPRVKDAVRLRSARHRAKQGRILIDGARELLQAMRGGVRLVEVFVCSQRCHSSESGAVLHRLETLAADVWDVPGEVFAKLAFGDRHDGVLAVAEAPALLLSELAPRGAGLIAVLAGVEKPGNVGAVLRSADAAGVSAVIVADPGTDLYNPNCIRASLGTVFTQPVCTSTTAETMAWLRDRKIRVFATRPDAERQYTEVDLGSSAAVVLGSESAGLSDAWLADDVQPIRLPMLGSADSLNVSAAAAVLFYHALSQRKR
ncbi:MAG: RNA methyltransferase [Planctomycetota bacterium]|nr:MAG: RNA methyltransferase [Planctomycetota bacterium]